MRAVVGHVLGGPACYRLEDVELAPCEAHEVIVDIHFAGVSLVDCLIAAGEYQVKPPLPFTPGSEFSGTVRATGSAVSHVQVGDRVAGAALGGAFADAIKLAARSVHRIPDAADFATAAIYRVSYATAYHSLVRRAALVAGETVLVLGASGAVGSAAIQVAKALGARVIASASGETKRRFCEANGADGVVDARSDDWRAALKGLCDGVDVVIDPVGGALSELAFRSLKWGGRFVVVGFASGDIPRLPLNLPLLKGASVTATDLRQHGIKQPVEAQADTAAVWALFEQGLTRPIIAATLALADFAAAMQLARKPGECGRVLLQMRA